MYDKLCVILLLRTRARCKAISQAGWWWFDGKRYDYVTYVRHQ